MLTRKFASVKPSSFNPSSSIRRINRPIIKGRCFASSSEENYASSLRNRFEQAMSAAASFHPETEKESEKKKNEQDNEEEIFFESSVRNNFIRSVIFSLANNRPVQLETQRAYDEFLRSSISTAEQNLDHDLRLWMTERAYARGEYLRVRDAWTGPNSSEDPTELAKSQRMQRKQDEDLLQKGHLETDPKANEKKLDMVEILDPAKYLSYVRGAKFPFDLDIFSKENVKKFRKPPLPQPMPSLEELLGKVC